MRFELELQFADFHPDQVDKVRPVDLKQALKVIHSYPWSREFEKIEERTMENLTSTVPNVSLRNKNGEILIVSARDNDNFIIELLTPTHRGELILDNNAFEGSAGAFTVGLLVLILILNFGSNGFSEKVLPAIYFVSVVILSMGLSALVTIQFLLTDWGKEVSFGQNGELTILTSLPKRKKQNLFGAKRRRSQNFLKGLRITRTQNLDK